MKTKIVFCCLLLSVLVIVYICSFSDSDNENSYKAVTQTEQQLPVDFDSNIKFKLFRETFVHNRDYNYFIYSEADQVLKRCQKMSAGETWPVQPTSQEFWQIKKQIASYDFSDSATVKELLKFLSALGEVAVINNPGNCDKVIVCYGFLHPSQAVQLGVRVNQDFALATIYRSVEIRYAVYEIVKTLINKFSFGSLFMEGAHSGQLIKRINCDPNQLYKRESFITFIRTESGLNHQQLISVDYLLAEFSATVNFRGAEDKQLLRKHQRILVSANYSGEGRLARTSHWLKEAVESGGERSIILGGKKHFEAVANKEISVPDNVCLIIFSDQGTIAYEKQYLPESIYKKTR